LKDAKFYLESKAPFTALSSIASFKLLLIAWLREYRTFSDSSAVSLKSSPWPKYTQSGSTFRKKIVFHYQIKLFSSSNMFFTRLFLAIPETKFGGHRTRLREKENLFRHRA